METVQCSRQPRHCRGEGMYLSGPGVYPAIACFLVTHVSCHLSIPPTFRILFLGAHTPILFLPQI